MKSSRYAHQSVILGNQLHLIGGSNQVKLSFDDSETIPISKNFRGQNYTIPEMHNGRRYFGMCSFARFIFVAGGIQNYNGYLDKCEVYSLELSKWTEVSSMNTKRSNFALIYFDDKIWAIGGYSNGTHLDTIETYNLAENKWTTANTKLLSKRSDHRAAVHNKKFFVIGGGNKNGNLSSVEVYSSETNQFSFVSSMNLRRANFGCCLCNSSLYVVGGIEDPNNRNVTDVSTVEIYEIENDVWNKGPSLPLKLSGIGCSSTEL